MSRATKLNPPKEAQPEIYDFPDAKFGEEFYGKAIELVHAKARPGQDDIVDEIARQLKVAADDFDKQSRIIHKSKKTLVDNFDARVALVGYLAKIDIKEGYISAEDLDHPDDYEAILMHNYYELDQETQKYERYGKGGVVAQVIVKTFASLPISLGGLERFGQSPERPFTLVLAISIAAGIAALSTKMIQSTIDLYVNELPWTTRSRTVLDADETIPQIESVASQNPLAVTVPMLCLGILVETVLFATWVIQDRAWLIEKGHAELAGTVAWFMAAILIGSVYVSAWNKAKVSRGYRTARSITSRLRNDSHFQALWAKLTETYMKVEDLMKYVGPAIWAQDRARDSLMVLSDVRSLDDANLRSDLKAALTGMTQIQQKGSLWKKFKAILSSWCGQGH